MRTITARTLIAFSLCLAAYCAIAQTTPPDNTLKLVNLDTPTVLGGGQTDVRLEYRAFGGSEGQGYGSAELNAGLSQGFGVIVRGTFSPFSNFNSVNGFTIRHGGDDIEALLKYSMPWISNLSLAVGAAEPNTPSHRSTFGVGELLYSVPARPASLYLGAKGEAGSSTDIAGLAAGFDLNLQGGLSLIGDFTWVFAGYTTYTTSWGARERPEVYGLALRYGGAYGRSAWGIDLGVTNGLGGSTGLSMTPALGTSVGLYAAAHYQF